MLHQHTAKYRDRMDVMPIIAAIILAAIIFLLVMTLTGCADTLGTAEQSWERQSANFHQSVASKHEAYNARMGAMRNAGGDQ